jgi:hypothetical protein
VEFEFSQLFVFGTVDAFALVDWESDDGLVVFDGGESSFLDARYGSVPGYDYY